MYTVKLLIFFIFFYFFSNMYDHLISIQNKLTVIYLCLN